MRILLSLTLLISTGAFAQDSIPAGTILPVQLNSSLRSAKLHPGSTVTARLMQGVPLPGSKIPAGAKLIGHVIAVEPQTAIRRAGVSLRFDALAIGKLTIHLDTDLRAMASMMDIAEAQVPESGPDRGTSEYYWTTEQIGGEVQYRGGGSVTRGSDVVGRTVPDGVLVYPSAKLGTKCRGAVNGNDRPQALWLFSSDACGLYDLPDVILLHAGRTQPRGEVMVQTAKNGLNVPAGSGLLLQVISPSQ